jgi:excisionase family DNA binding protein
LNPRPSPWQGVQGAWTPLVTASHPSSSPHENSSLEKDGDVTASTGEHRFARVLLPGYYPKLQSIKGDLLTVKQVAAALQISAATVYKLVNGKHLSSVRVLNSIRIHRAELERLLADFATGNRK